jgi:hypothetical protein
MCINIAIILAIVKPIEKDYVVAVIMLRNNISMICWKSDVSQKRFVSENNSVKYIPSKDIGCQFLCQCRVSDFSDVVLPLHVIM